eukprot:6764716-Prymnesium_polylepis.2
MAPACPASSVLHRRRACARDAKSSPRVGRRCARARRYANAQFGVTRDRVAARPLSFYRELLGYFEGPPEQECFKAYDKAKPRAFRGTCGLLEWLWPSLLGEDTLLNPKHTMINSPVVR